MPPKQPMRQSAAVFQLVLFLPDYSTQLRLVVAWEDERYISYISRLEVTCPVSQYSIRMNLASCESRDHSSALMAIGTVRRGNGQEMRSAECDLASGV